MNARTSALLMAIAAAFLSCVLAATRPLAADIQLTPIVADVLWAPQPVRGSDSHAHLVFACRPDRRDADEREHTQTAQVAHRLFDAIECLC